MHFEAEMDSQKYLIEVQELTDHWLIIISESNKSPVTYKINKSDFVRQEEYYSFLHKGASYLVDVLGHDGIYTIWTRNYARKVRIVNDQIILQQALRGHGIGDSQRVIRAGLPGKVIQVFVKPGDEVRPNKPILIVEAMKMENEIRAWAPAKVKKVFVQQGDSVEAGSPLVEFE